MLLDGKIKNMFIFGEDPMGSAVYREEIEGWIDNCEFLVLQDSLKKPL